MRSLGDAKMHDVIITSHGWWRVTLEALVVCVLLAAVTSHVSVKDYVIVGAGPAGLQLGYFLEKAGRDYIILERENISGSFFRVYPRHGKLISINKRHTGSQNAEFNLRHDWNSLLSDDAAMLFQHFSHDFFPDNKAMLRYLAAFTDRFGIRVVYNTDVVDIQKMEAPDGWQGTEEIFRLTDQNGRVYWCRTLLSATGMWIPNKPMIPGMEQVEGYENIPTEPESFEGQSVLVLGHGNAAFETAQVIYERANFVHLLGRSRVRMAWETHYVGDLRGLNNNVLDTYQLKSLDGVVEGDLSSLRLQQTVDGKIRARLQQGEGPETDNFALRHSYDRVIRCLGFRYDTSLFNSSLDVALTRVPASKYPALGADYQSTSAAGLYVIGTASHAVDYRRSAGGFIHGFRYTVRAVHRLLEWKNHRVKWPHTSRPFSDLLSFVVNRINQASGLYQMYGVLCDVIILDRPARQFTYLEEVPMGLLADFTTITGHQLATSYIIISLEYGKNFSGPGHDVFREGRATGFAHQAQRSNFLHPVLYHYASALTDKMFRNKPSDWSLPRPSRLHHVLEDFLTDWSRDYAHVLPLRRFLETCVGQTLTNFFSDSCLVSVLVHSNPPLSCASYMGGRVTLARLANSHMEGMRQAGPQQAPS